VNPEDKIKELIGKSDIVTDAQVENRILSDALEHLNMLKQQKSTRIGHYIWTIIMKNSFTKLAAVTAGIITMVVILSLSFLGESATPAYGIEQTIQANHSVRYIHIKHFDSEYEDDPFEFWVRCGEFGQIESTRVRAPERSSSGNGVLVGVWNQNELQVWSKKRNILFLCSDSTLADNLLDLLEKCDPRLAVQHLYERQQRNEIKLEIDEPSDKAKPIVITATCLPESSTPDLRAIVSVDRVTKLVTCVEAYRLRNGIYEYVGRQEYYDYNRPIPDEMFTLEDELPADVIVVDWLNQEVGLAQGQLSEDEVAVEVVRRFFEALIAKDYVEAGRLLAGIPADLLEQGFDSVPEQVNLLRILSIGPAAPHPELGTQARIVPCILEIEIDGEISHRKWDRIGVRQVYNQPGRWAICDGIRNFKKVLFLDR
jgi:hypothetical protein